MSKTIVLSRVSSSHQDLTQQTDEILREVHRDGYEDRDIIIIEDTESAINLSEEERRGLNKMKDHINRNTDIACVYLYELSRLSRRQLVLFSIRDFLVERKIQLICLKPYFRLLEVDGTMSQTGSLMFSLFSSLSESEMMLKKERMMRGRRRNRELGKSAGGKPPFGYDLNKEKRYIVNPSESTLIVRIFEDYTSRHKSIREIATDLKEEGHFAASSINTLCLRIRTILNNSIYTGEFPYPQILSKDLYSAAQQALALYNETHKRKGKAPFLLKGLTCDARTGYQLSTNGAIDTYFSKHHAGVSIRRTNIDPVVWEYAKMMYERYVMNRDRLLRQIKTSYETTAQKISVVEGDMQTIQTKLERVEESYILGRISQAKAEHLRQQLYEDRARKERRKEELIEFVKTHQIQRVVCLEISRMGRNTLEALKVIQLLNEHKVSLYVKNYNLETFDSEGKVNPVASLICTILLEIAQMERLTIKERMASGRKQYIEKCRREGIKMGRPETYRKSMEEYKKTIPERDLTDS